jgi:hypothetical protein
MTDDLDSIRVMIARVEERQIAAVEASDHFRNNLKMRLDGLATKVEMQGIRDDVEELKDHKKWQDRTIAGAWIAGLGVVWAVVTKKFT